MYTFNFTKQTENTLKIWFWDLVYSCLKCSVAHVCASPRPHLVADWLKNTIFIASEIVPINQSANFSTLLLVHNQCKSGVKIQVLNSCQQTDLLPVAVSSLQHVEGDHASMYLSYRKLIEKEVGHYFLPQLKVPRQLDCITENNPKKTITVNQNKSRPNNLRSK